MVPHSHQYGRIRHHQLLQEAGAWNSPLNCTLVPFQNAWSYTARLTYTYTELYLVKRGDKFTMLCTLKWGLQVPPNRWLPPNYTASHSRRQETQTIQENTKEAQI